MSTPSPASDYFRELPRWFVQNWPCLRRICISYSGKGTFALHVARGLQEAVESLGYHEVRSLRLNPERLDQRLDQMIDQIRALKPDVLVLAARFELDLQLLRARNQWPKSVKVIAAVAAGVRAFYEQLRQPAEGVIGPSQWEPTIDFKDIRGPDSGWFIERVRKRYGKIPDYTTAGGFGVGLIFQECAEQAGSVNDESLYQVATRLDLNTFFGRFRIDPENGRQVGHRILLTQWQEGRKIVLSTDS